MNYVNKTIFFSFCVERFHWNFVCANTANVFYFSMARARAGSFTSRAFVVSSNAQHTQTHTSVANWFDLIYKSCFLTSRIVNREWKWTHRAARARTHDRTSTDRRWEKWKLRKKNMESSQCYVWHILARRTNTRTHGQWNTVCLFPFLKTSDLASCDEREEIDEKKYKRSLNAFNIIN